MDFLDIMVDRKLTYNEIQRGLVRILSLEPESMLLGETSNIWNSYKGQLIVSIYEYTQGDFPTIIEVDFQQSTFQTDLLKNIINTLIQFCQELNCAVLSPDPNLSPLELPPKFTYQFIDTYLFITSDGRFKYVDIDIDSRDDNKIFKIIK